MEQARILRLLHIHMFVHSFALDLPAINSLFAGVRRYLAISILNIVTLCSYNLFTSSSHSRPIHITINIGHPIYSLTLAERALILMAYPDD
jgi:hypothetical protein